MTKLSFGKNVNQEFGLGVGHLSVQACRYKLRIMSLESSALNQEL